MTSRIRGIRAQRPETHVFRDPGRGATAAASPAGFRHHAPLPCQVMGDRERAENHRESPRAAGALGRGDDSAAPRARVERRVSQTPLEPVCSARGRPRHALRPPEVCRGPGRATQRRSRRGQSGRTCRRGPSPPPVVASPRTSPRVLSARANVLAHLLPPGRTSPVSLPRLHILRT